MKATDLLVEEHRVIERVLNTLEIGVKRLETGQSVRPEFFLSAVDFIRGFADGCHHQKEEGILFVRLEEQGIPLQGCPLGVMLAEHQLARQYTRALESAALDIRSGNSGARMRAIESSRSYINLLRQHIRKEDTQLFPMANAVIPSDQHTGIWDDFAHVDASDGIYQKYLTLAEVLEQETRW
jgi:hemerythrin-like domain-containing protein